MEKYSAKIRITSTVSYRLVWVEKFPDSQTLGECCSVKRKIFIKKGMSPRATRQVLIHELLHALEFEFAIPIPHKVVYGLATALEKLVRLN